MFIMINLKRIHHVAYRCKDAKETVDWYKEVLNMGAYCSHCRK